MEKKIALFHGSEKVIEHPVFGEGKKHNDFGLGFYCTESEALAKEWAVSSLRDGFANRYTLDTEYLRVLHLNSPDYTILNWIAVLVEHRLFSIKTPVARRAKQYLIDNFSVNVNAYDLITGYGVSPPPANGATRSVDEAGAYAGSSPEIPDLQCGLLFLPEK